MTVMGEQLSPISPGPEMSLRLRPARAAACCAAGSSKLTKAEQHCWEGARRAGVAAARVARAETTKALYCMLEQWCQGWSKPGASHEPLYSRIQEHLHDNDIVIRRQETDRSRSSILMGRRKSAHSKKTWHIADTWFYIW